MSRGGRGPAPLDAVSEAPKRGGEGRPGLKSAVRLARDVDGGPPAGASLWTRLVDSHDLMLSEVRRRLAATCSLPRFELLAYLEREDGQTPAALSRRMRVTAGNLTGLVDRAERDGVVERRADPGDRRLSRVFLTSRGRELVQGLLPEHAAHVSELLSVLRAGERRELRRLLGRLRESLVARELQRTTRPSPRRTRTPREKR